MMHSNTITHSTNTISYKSQDLLYFKIQSDRVILITSGVIFLWKGKMYTFNRKCLKCVKGIGVVH